MKHPARKPVKATKQQAAALRYLISQGWTEKIPANGLMGWYEDRARIRLEEESPEHARKFGHSPGTNRRHAWRRTSGRVLEQMAEAGLLAHDGMDRYTWRFKITDEGRAAVEEA
jgi:hypothetical protein